MLTVRMTEDSTDVQVLVRLLLNDVSKDHESPMTPADTTEEVDVHLKRRLLDAESHL